MIKPTRLAEYGTYRQRYVLERAVLQQVRAQQIGISPILTAANSSGGVMGKMIDAQNIVLAGVVTGQQGDEGDILRHIFFHSTALGVLVGLLVLSQAHLFPALRHDHFKGRTLDPI